MLKNKFDRLYREIVFNGHLQSVGASSAALLSSIYVLKVTPSLVMLILIYATFQVVFFFDRIMDIEKDKETNKLRAEHISSNINTIKTFLFVYLLVVLLGNLIYSNVAALLFCVGIVIFGLLYPIFFKGLTRKIPLFKNIYVTSVYSLAIFYPYLFNSNFNFINTASIYIFVLVFLEMGISQVSLDIKDIRSDNKVGLKTLPVILGSNRTIQVLYIIGIVNLFILLLFMPGSLQTIQLLGFLIINFVYNYIFIYKIRNKEPVGYLLSAGKFSAWLLYLLLV